MNETWRYLSYSLSPKLSGYGNGDRIDIKRVRNQLEGHSSNNTVLHFPSHYGTHIDYPFHFDIKGNSGDDYGADFFVFRKTSFLEIPLTESTDLIITPEMLSSLPESNSDLLIIKTGFCSIRDSQRYWEENPGFAPETAQFINEKLTKLRAIGFDSISLSSYQHRELGRLAHKEFLSKFNILIIEDMDLRNTNAKTQFSRVIVAPLRFDGADGAPVTVLASLTHEI